MIIAIDGPAASGKGTLARALAARLNFAHLDSGALYRAVALALIQGGGQAADEAAAVAAARNLDLSLLRDPRLRDEATGQAASTVARYPGVRAALLDVQRGFAATPPDGKGGAVIDGRDIGTIVCPNAAVKIFLSAAPAVRAARRARELADRGIKVDQRAVLAEITARDAQDRSRAVAPLRAAADAVLLDTSDLDIEAALAAALAIVDKARHPS